ncbi:MAG: hypothetical protein RR380_04595, partial [Gordonibacter sp.]
MRTAKDCDFQQNDAPRQTKDALGAAEKPRRSTREHRYGVAYALSAGALRLAGAFFAAGFFA